LAALTGPTVLGSGGGGGETRWALLQFQKVTAADSFDCSTLTTIAAFQVVSAGCFLSTSNRTAVATVSTISAQTVVAMLGSGVAADAGVLLVIGE
jgi:hypothetical protein